MNEIIKVTDLSMKIGKQMLFEDINFTVYGSEIVGLLGHNGVGKSTMQRILANREQPSSGKVFNLGVEYQIDKYTNNVVYVPDTVVLIPNLSILENYNLIAQTRSVNDQFFEKYIKALRLDRSAQVRSLSKGNQEIVQIIILLSIDASLYLLDEPFSAVDIFRRELIQKIIIDLSFRNEQSSIIITSHLINEIEPMLSRILYLDEGQIVIDCEIDQIYHHSSNLFEYLKSYFGEKVGFDNV